MTPATSTSREDLSKPRAVGPLQLTRRSCTEEPHAPSVLAQQQQHYESMTMATCIMCIYCIIGYELSKYRDIFENIENIENMICSIRTLVAVDGQFGPL